MTSQRAWSTTSHALSLRGDGSVAAVTALCGPGDQPIGGAYRLFGDPAALSTVYVAGSELNDPDPNAATGWRVALASPVAVGTVGLTVIVYCAVG